MRLLRRASRPKPEAEHFGGAELGSDLRRRL